MIFFLCHAVENKLYMLKFKLSQAFIHAPLVHIGAADTDGFRSRLFRVADFGFSAI